LKRLLNWIQGLAPSCDGTERGVLAADKTDKGDYQSYAEGIVIDVSLRLELVVGGIGKKRQFGTLRIGLPLVLAVDRKQQRRLPRLDRGLM
jgi:hypothetical protein